ncbi:MAG: hypothetical protein JXQ96_09585 [Cyclobacteriaceae bacterium]
MSGQQFKPGTTFKPSNKVNLPWLIGTSIILLPVLGIIGTLYGYGSRFGVYYLMENVDEELSAGLGIFLFILVVFSTKEMVHWFFNRSKSRNLVLNQRIILILTLYFWYCSYTGLVFEDFFVEDLAYGMLLRISVFDLYHLVAGFEWYWTIIHIMELGIIIFLFVIGYKEQQEIYCENCQKYLRWREFYMMGKAHFPKSELETGNVKDVLSKMDFLSPKSFQRNRKPYPCLEITYQTCNSCDLAVIEIDAGRAVASDDPDYPNSTFEKEQKVCYNLIIDKQSKEYLGN